MWVSWRFLMGTASRLAGHPHPCRRHRPIGCCPRARKKPRRRERVRGL